MTIATDRHLSVAMVFFMRSIEMRECGKAVSLQSARRVSLEDCLRSLPWRLHIFRGSDNMHYEKVGKDVVCIEDEIPFEIPKNWVWTRMGNIGDWGAGATPAKSKSDYYGGNVLWLRTGELNNSVVYDTEIKVTDKALKDCSLRLNNIGDVLIAMYGATIGKLAIVGQPLTTNQACCACTPFCIYNWYLFYFLMAEREKFIRKGEGGAQPNISRQKLVEHLIPLPPILEQQRIVSQIEKLFEHLH